VPSRSREELARSGSSPACARRPWLREDLARPATEGGARRSYAWCPRREEKLARPACRRRHGKSLPAGVEVLGAGARVQGATRLPRQSARVGSGRCSRLGVAAVMCLASCRTTRGRCGDDNGEFQRRGNGFGTRKERGMPRIA
jgi:hypothetical protein